jgi:hypothetical protein
MPKSFSVQKQAQKQVGLTCFWADLIMFALANFR